MTLDPHLAALIVSSATAGLLMTLAGVSKNGLEWRRAPHLPVLRARAAGPRVRLPVLT